MTRNAAPQPRMNTARESRSRTARSVWSAEYSPAFGCAMPHQSGGIPRTPNASRPSTREKPSQPDGNFGHSCAEGHGFAERLGFRTSSFGFRHLARQFLFVLTVVVAGGRAEAQFAEGKVAKIEIKHVGPQSVSDELIRANIRVKVGDPYLRTAVDDDVRNLYATGLFYNIRVADEITPEGVALTYVVQGNPRLTEIKF